MNYRRIIVLGIFLVLQSSTAQALDVIVARAVSVELADPIEALGTLRANESADLTSSITEIISEIRFSDGERVTAGDVLVALTNREQLAELASAEASVEEARRQYQRVQDLAGRGQESRAVLDQRQRELNTALARLQGVEARLSDRLIVAPFDGVLGLRNVSVGSLLTPGTIVTTILDDSVMKLDFSVPERFLALVEPGLDIEARSSAFPDERFTGHVIGLSNQVDPVTRSFRVRAEIPNERLALRPGMLMNVVLKTGSRQGLTIPEEAVLSRGRDHYVFVADVEEDTRVRRRDVELGARYPGFVEIRSGLSEGESVVIHGGFRLSDGDRVRVRAELERGQSLAAILAGTGES
ncbi:MAG: efflux RND transporter periplasmic adaptor subunit [Wenzhouxiangella sp.]|nr:MAG: efflux RND transporter periplasmic adaptor subunit [Wenzhouxiangella sp.]